MVTHESILNDFVTHIEDAAHDAEAAGLIATLDARVTASFLRAIVDKAQTFTSDMASHRARGVRLRRGETFSFAGISIDWAFPEEPAGEEKAPEGEGT